MPFFGGVREIFLVYKIGSCPIYVQLMDVAEIRNRWDQGGNHTRILGAGYMDNEIIGSRSLGNLFLLAIWVSTSTYQNLSKQWKIVIIFQWLINIIEEWSRQSEDECRTTIYLYVSFLHPLTTLFTSIH